MMELINADPLMAIDAIQFDGFDDAISGVSHDGYLIYGYDKMIDCLLDDMTQDEAAEWIDFNVMGVNAGNGFIVMYSDEGI